MTPARARKLKEKSPHLKLVVSNPPKETPMPFMLFWSLPFIFATAAYDGCMDALLGPLPESL